MELTLYLTLGLTIGILSGFFGIGGGFILTPILLLLGFNPVIAIATSLSYSIATSLSGVFAHLRLKNINWKDAGIIGFSGVFATQIAHPFTLMLQRYQIEDTVIPILYILLITYFTYSMFKPNSVLPQNDSQPSFYVVRLILIGVFAGFASTTLGVGGGFIIVPLLIRILGYPSNRAVGTSLLSVMMIVLIGFITYSFSTPLNIKISIYLFIGALIGGQIGAVATRLFEDDQIRYFLGGLYLATGLSIFLKMLNLDVIGLLVILLYCLFILVAFLGKAIKVRITHHQLENKDAS